ncbi:hypothetical protein H8959_014254 [Pygathrix nigripes]
MKHVPISPSDLLQPGQPLGTQPSTRCCFPGKGLLPPGLSKKRGQVVGEKRKRWKGCESGAGTPLSQSSITQTTRRVPAPQDRTPGVVECLGLPPASVESPPPASRAGSCAPAAPSRSRPRSPPRPSRRACAPCPRPSPAAVGARACPSSRAGAGDGRRLLDEERAPGAPRARLGEAGARALAWPRAGAAAAAPLPPCRGPGRGAEREGRALRAGGHGQEPEAAAAAAGPAGGEARGPRPLTAPDCPWRPGATPRSLGGRSLATPGAPAHPPLPFFSWPGAREHARAWPRPAKS